MKLSRLVWVFSNTFMIHEQRVVKSPGHTLIAVEAAGFAGCLAGAAFLVLVDLVDLEAIMVRTGNLCFFSGTQERNDACANALVMRTQ